MLRSISNLRFLQASCQLCIMMHINSAFSRVTSDWRLYSFALAQCYSKRQLMVFLRCPSHSRFSKKWMCTSKSFCTHRRAT